MKLAKLNMNNIFALSVCFVFAILGICSGEMTPGEIYNADFELFDPNDGSGFDKPTGWNIDNYAASVTLFIPELEWPEHGSNENWKINPVAGLDPFAGNRLAILSTGEILPKGSTNHSTISQNIQIYAGQTLSGVYFFGTHEELVVQFDDRAEIKLVPDANSFLRGINLVTIEASDPSVGSFGSTDGWQNFDRLFTQEEEGVYDLVCHVEDIGDAKVNSYLGVDHLMLCTAPEYGDINYDCQTDLMDFWYLADTWQYDYRDPNNIPDPNSAEYREILYGDLDNNDWVNSVDLSLMTSSWLTGQ